jgi:glycerol-3-phosphate dehydrogenase (NAD(P)+)
MAVHLAGTGRPVALWSRRRDLAESLAAERVNREYLPSAPLPDSVTPTCELAAMVDSEILVVAVPSHGFREVLSEYLRLHPPERPAVIVSATKGIETETLARMSQVSFEEGIAADREVHFGVLSGPSFAAELAAGSPTVVVIASEETDLAAELREELSTATLRLYSSDDVTGVELGGTAKNVIAIAAGIISGLKMGHNTLAALITRGLHEITRLGLACGGQARTFSGLAGLGDLVLTCTGGLSRNRHIGVELARGRKLAELTGETHMVAEGVRNSLAISRLAAQRGVEMPITEQMVQILYEGRTPVEAVTQLMNRELKAEAEL